jgi:hypothetical protein
MSEYVQNEFRPFPHFKMPSNDAGWRKRLYGLKNAKPQVTSEEEDQLLQPDLQVASRIDSHTAFVLLKYHLNWMRDDSLKDTEGLWLFVLLIRLDPLLTSDQVSVLRDLCRKCKKIRKALFTNEHAGEPEEILKETQDTPLRSPLNKTSKEVAALNMVIAVIAEVFGQRDLQDPMMGHSDLRTRP